MSAPSAQPHEREIVFCHECEEEWYRDEHGLVCPQCQSSFTEIIDGNNDPREEMVEHDGDEHDHFAPDPEEEDITHFQWTHPHPGQHTDGQPAGAQGGLNFGGGLFGLLGNVIRTAFDPAAPPNEEDQAHGDHREGPGDEHGQQPSGMPQAPNGTFVRVHNGQGPNFSYTITTTSNANLFPRDANGPQPFQTQPAQINDIMNQIMANIGAVPTVVRINGGGPGLQARGPAGAMPLNIMGLFGAPDRFGDAVFSQEALDRVITQLMDQHQSGNAPGPASEQAIESLPKRDVTEKDLDDSGKAECSICMDETPLGTSVTVLPCSHWFHHDCIKAWLIEHDTCPHCRQGITARDQTDTGRARDASEAPLHDMHSPAYQSSGVPGSYPFPSSSSGSGAQQGPSSPGSHGSPEARPQSQRGGGVSDLFSRMREAFGGGGGGNGGSDGN